MHIHSNAIHCAPSDELKPNPDAGPFERSFERARFAHRFRLETGDAPSRLAAEGGRKEGKKDDARPLATRRR